MRNKYCVNCGIYGHEFNYCNKPIISIGIILYYKLNNNIEFLMIRRKHTLGYIEFIRGNYNYNNIHYIKKLFSVMSINEKNLILNKNYEYLWKNLWHIRTINKNGKYLSNENKFNKIKQGFFINNQFINMKILFNNIYNWDETEWEFPKGKRKLNENDISTAIREFNEETGIDEQNYNIIDNKIFKENYIGINNLKYRNIYFLAKCINNDIPQINYKNKSQFCEISKIDWFNYNNAHHKIRPYYKEKQKILYNIFNYILEIENINNNNNDKKNY